jgi:hypothetical protein
MAAHDNLPAYSSLERVVQQVTVVRQYLQQEVGKVTSELLAILIQHRIFLKKLFLVDTYIIGSLVFARFINVNGCLCILSFSSLSLSLALLEVLRIHYSATVLIMLLFLTSYCTHDI